jgi:hypothetical protein
MPEAKKKGGNSGKPKPRKLGLKKETLKDLSAKRPEQVQGGGWGGGCNPTCEVCTC